MMRGDGRIRRTRGEGNIFMGQGREQNNDEKGEENRITRTGGGGQKNREKGGGHRIMRAGVGEHNQEYRGTGGMEDTVQ